jgi:sterol desaturase/sphingolipid hydroxylase (fatty acid hydroxylase superfamily)
VLLAGAFNPDLCEVRIHNEVSSGFLETFARGYVAYEKVHYASHSLKWGHPAFVRLQKHHMYHHYRNPDSSDGLTGTFWDRIFRTRYEDLGDAP